MPSVAYGQDPAVYGPQTVVFGGEIVTTKPGAFTPHGAPDFVELRLSAYKTSTGGEWWRTRQIIRPRLQLVHTNGASGEGSIESAINWGNAASGNTKPHYQVDRYRAAKLVPTDRRAIGNGTVDAYQNSHGDVGEWSIVIETADEGYPTPGENGGFIGDQIEMIAQILAYESITHGIPLEPPDYWWGPGTAAHTEPFGYPYWTIAQGKVCPGRTKKRQLREQVIPRARQIAAEWTSQPDTPPEDDDMQPLPVPDRVYDSRTGHGPFGANEVRTIAVGMCTKAHVHITAISSAPGFVSVSGTDDRSPASLVNFDTDQVESGGAPIGVPDGHLRVFCSAPADIIVDVYARG